MSALFLALVLSPHVQERARAELDLVVGRDQLPTFDDRPRLPYIEALCRELTRWLMPGPIGLSVPSRLSKYGYEKYYSQDFPMRQLKTMFIGGSSFRRVCLFCSFCP
jgi:hypothetical protein